MNIRYFTNDKEPGRIESATHNTLERKPRHDGDKYPGFPSDVLWVAFSIPPDSLSLVKYSVYSNSKFNRTLDTRSFIDTLYKVRNKQ
jgi:hypothetical protein